MQGKEGGKEEEEKKGYVEIMKHNCSFWVLMTASGNYLFSS